MEQFVHVVVCNANLGILKNDAFSVEYLRHFFLSVSVAGSAISIGGHVKHSLAFPIQWSSQSVPSGILFRMYSIFIVFLLVQYSVIKCDTKSTRKGWRQLCKAFLPSSSFVRSIEWCSTSNARLFNGVKSKWLRWIGLHKFNERLCYSGLSRALSRLGYSE